MRILLHALSLAVVFAVAAVALPATAKIESAERTVTREDTLVSGTTLAVENLLGSLEVQGGGLAGRIRVEARVVVEAETKEKADEIALGFDVVRRDTPGVATLHVTFPTDRYTVFRAPRGDGNVFQRYVAPLLKRDKIAVDYDGRTVEIANGKGALAAAVHLKIVVPTEIAGVFKQVAGTLRGSRLRGSLRFESMAARVTIEQVYSELVARTGGGALTVRTFKGDRIELESGSGDMDLEDVQAKDAVFRSTSGAIRGARIVASAIAVRSGSGDVELAEVDPATVRIETDSGGVLLATRLKNTREAAIRSGSGDVTLRVGDVTPFTLDAKTRSGSVSTRGVEDLKVEEQAKNAARYRRGTGGPNVAIETVSGGVTLASIR